MTQSSQQTMKYIENRYTQKYTPKNGGCIIAGTIKDPSEKNAKFIKTGANVLYEYHPRGFVMRNNDNMKLITSYRKIPCKKEIECNGHCDMLNDPNHRKFHYHFSRDNSTEHGRLPVCKYTQDQCWEYNTDPRHKHNFFHLHSHVEEERTDSEIDYSLDWGEYND